MNFHGLDPGVADPVKQHEMDLFVLPSSCLFLKHRVPVRIHMRLDRKIELSQKPFDSPGIVLLREGLDGLRALPQPPCPSSRLRRVSGG